jgi:NAD(P)H dehydrogenase (quinone)
VNGDKFATIAYFFTLSQQHGQIWIGTGLLPANAKASGPDDVNWTAGSAGALAISPSDASPDEAPRAGDLETARLLGVRVAEYAAKTR